MDNDAELSPKKRALSLVVLQLTNVVVDTLGEFAVTADP